MTAFVKKEQDDCYWDILSTYAAAEVSSVIIYANGT